MLSAGMAQTLTIVEVAVATLWSPMLTYGIGAGGAGGVRQTSGVQML
jgi:hypothetical protein